MIWEWFYKFFIWLKLSSRLIIHTYDVAQDKSGPLTFKKYSLHWEMQIELDP